MKAELITTTKQMFSQVRLAEELYMEDNSKPFNHHGCWKICKGWVLFENPPQERVAPMPVVGDEHESPTIQETRAENLSSGEGSIPRAMG
ncbi:hypothetical protein D8674_006903 [Pyrus ussuriensis x Pyrus communis]|uniref:Uncharacterized protein n=1 Tax=Pyrus ussuriensis x Pyrus communis TaxID=2448454 RepID=A0A5N5FVM1_9ROSA|nr:hypothetical protein D8674_006903 [Pyrus ussuriensis x Pyrus communis]